MELSHLRVNHMEAPCVDGEIEFSWCIVSAEKNVTQLSYRLVVENNGMPVWDSGTVTGSRQSFIAYTGPKLLSGEQYTYTVTVCTMDGDSAEASGCFFTGLDVSDWKAHWVESTFPRNPHQMLSDGIENPVLSFRRTFPVKKTVRSAVMYATCFGAYRLLVNDARADDREFAPEFTSYGKLLYYQRYDITCLLSEGDNTLEMLVGDGWYFNSQTVPIGSDHEKPAILYQLELEYEDGSHETVYSDGSEECRQTNVLYSDLFVGEKIDLTKSCSEPARTEIRDYPLNILRSQAIDPVKAVEIFPVKAVLHSPAGELIFDFGQVIAGRCRIRLCEDRGTEVRLHHTEVLDKEGNYFATLSSRQREIIICNGEEVFYEPLFTFHGFRYIKIEGASRIRAEDVTAVLLSTQKENKGSFECSEPELNRLYKNIRYSQKNNMMSIPTDCPQREKAGWTGDVLVYNAASMLNEEMTPFYESWLSSLLADQQPNGAIPITCPSTKMYDFMLRKIGSEYDASTPVRGLEDILPVGEETASGGELPSVAGWSDVIIELPYNMYRLTGNEQILTKCLPAMKRYADQLIRTASARRGNASSDQNDRYLWNTGFHFGEWLVPGKEKPGFEACPETAWYIAPFYAFHSVSLLAEICRLLGDDAASVHYLDVAGKMKAAIEAEILPIEHEYSDYMGRYILALAFGLVEGDLKQQYVKKLTDLVLANNCRLGTGFLATPYILRVLDQIGRHDLALNILLQPDCPGWLYEVRMGATAIWESWSAILPDGTPQKISFDHYAFGVVDEYLFSSVAGIRPLLPGFAKFEVCPDRRIGLDWMKRAFVCEAGLISVSYRGSNLEVVVPPNTCAVVKWNGQTREIGSGKWLFS